MILLIGGTGFLGSLVFARLNAAGYPIKVYTRGVNDWQNSVLTRYRNLGAEVFLADIRDPNSLEKAIAGSTIIINLSGLMRADAENTYYETHVQSMKYLVELAEKHGIQRVIHLSCLGSDEHSTSTYYASKAQGEELVKQGKFHWTIFRPSFMFGENFVLFEILIPLVKNLPFTPVIGGGLNRFSPVWVEDVACCIEQCLYNRETAGQSYNLAGPKTYTLAQIMQMLTSRQNKKRPSIDVSSKMALGAIKLYQKLNPEMHLTEDVIGILTADSCGDPEVMKRTFKVEMKNLDGEVDRLLMGQL